MAKSPLIDPTPDNANEGAFDAAIRHQIGIRRLSGTEAKRVVKLLEKADKDLVQRLRQRLTKFAGKPADFTTKRFKALIRDIRTARAEVLKQLRTSTRKNLKQLAKQEAEFEINLLQQAIPVEISIASVQIEKLNDIVTKKAFQGRNLQQWFDSLQRIDQRRLVDQLQLGLTNQETIDQMVRRVVGSRANGFRDGVLSATRREGEAIVRTAVNHVSNQAREQVWVGNEDIIQGLRWTALLDGRTTPICRGRDGKFATIGNKPLPNGFPPLSPNGARPPAHVNCRSVMVAVLDSDGVAGKLPERAFVTDTRTRQKREVDFRKRAKATGRDIRDVRKAWAQKNIGRLPGNITYQEFLFRQPQSFQIDVLGKTRAALFRKGGIKLDEFVDFQGKQITLARLAKDKPKVFVKAGLDPDDF